MKDNEASRIGFSAEDMFGRLTADFEYISEGLDLLTAMEPVCIDGTKIKTVAVGDHANATILTEISSQEGVTHELIVTQGGKLRSVMFRDGEYFCNEGFSVYVMRGELNLFLSDAIGKLTEPGV